MPSKKTTPKVKAKKKISTVMEKQKLVAKEFLENRGDTNSIGAAMVKVGYSKAYAKNPKQLMVSKSWAQLMDEYLPESLIAEKHQALLNKKEQIVLRTGKETEIVVTDEIDANAVAKGIDMAYKIRGTYAPEKLEHKITAVEVVKYGDVNVNNKITN